MQINSKLLNEFNNTLKGLADKNSEKEKEMKDAAQNWIAQQIVKKDTVVIDQFFEYVRSHAESVQKESPLSIGAFNTFGIFAQAIKDDSSLKEKYIPVMLRILIDTYLTKDPNPRVSWLAKLDQEDRDLQSALSYPYSSASDLPKPARHYGGFVPDEKRPDRRDSHLL
jgi:translation initiation factor 2B subunit (eIF-2B alpha/beta/delta family)